MPYELLDELILAAVYLTNTFTQDHLLNHSPFTHATSLDSSGVIIASRSFNLLEGGTTKKVRFLALLHHPTPHPGIKSAFLISSPHHLSSRTVSPYISPLTAKMTLDGANHNTDNTAVLTALISPREIFTHAQSAGLRCQR
jgi:hypothetical protein